MMQGIGNSLRCRRELFFLTLLFIVTRVFLLFRVPEMISISEELYRGTIAKELLRGLSFPLWDYQADVYSGGSLVVGFIASLYYRCLGPSLGALKLVPLTFSALTFVLSYSFLKRYFSLSAARFAATLLLIGNPFWVTLSSYAMGFHSESVFFSILIWTLLFKATDTQKPTHPIAFFAFGVISGLGIWFTYITAITFLTALFSWPLLGRKTLSLGQIFRTVSGLFIGLLPWLIYNRHHSDQGIAYIFTSFLSAPHDPFPDFLSHLLRKSGLLLFKGYLQMPFYSDVFFVPGRFSTLIFTMGLWISFAMGSKLLFKSSELKALLPFVSYPIIYTLIYLFSFYEVYSGLPLECRYYAPLQYHLFLTAAIVASKIIPARRVIVVLIAFGLWGWTPWILAPAGTNPFQLRGYSYAQLGELWVPDKVEWKFQFMNTREFQFGMQLNPLDQRAYFESMKFGNLASLSKQPAEIRRWVASLPDNIRPLGYDLWGSTVAGSDLKSAQAAKIMLPDVPDEGRSPFCRGLARSVIYDLRNTESDFVNQIQGYPEPCRRELFFQAGYAAAYLADETRKQWIQAIRPSFSSGDARWFDRGLGRGQASLAFFSAAAIHQEIHLLQGDPANVAWGFGWGLFESMPEDERRCDYWLNFLPQANRAAARSGILDASRAFGYGL